MTEEDVNKLQDVYWKAREAYHNARRLLMRSKNTQTVHPLNQKRAEENHKKLVASIRKAHDATNSMSKEANELYAQQRKAAYDTFDKTIEPYKIIWEETMEESQKIRDEIMSEKRS